MWNGNRMRRWSFVLAAVALAGCGDEEPAVFPGDGPLEVTFPAELLWGATTTSFQVERGLGHTDWGIWAALPDKVEGGDLPDDGPDALGHVREDVERMRAMGLTSYRLGLELARVYPSQEAFDANEPDAAGLAAYDELVNALVAAGITPMVTLHDYVWPAYLSDPLDGAQPQGWERIDARVAFEVWCHHMAAHFGDRVDLWITINEPTLEASAGYLEGSSPPGVSDAERMTDVLADQLEGHARCYDAIHQSDEVDADRDGVAALVSIAAHQRAFEPADATRAADRAAAEHSRRFWNLWFLDAIVRGDVDENFDDAIDVEGDPALAGRADFVAVNYFGPAQIDAGSDELEHVGHLPLLTGLASARPKTDLGWDIDAPGLGRVLDEVAGYGLPIFVTENGVADAADHNRARFVAEHAWEIGLARARGLDVRGYFYGALIDGFEWAAGFCPRFGLYAVDFGSAARTRSETSAVAVLSALAGERYLDRERVEALAPYRSTSAACEL
jgi:beta-glucosidase